MADMEAPQAASWTKETDMVAFSITDLMNWCFHRGQEAREQRLELQHVRECVAEQSKQLTRYADKLNERDRVVSGLMKENDVARAEAAKAKSLANILLDPSQTKQSLEAACREFLGRYPF